MILSLSLYMVIWRRRGRDENYKKGERAAAHLSCSLFYSGVGLAVAALAAATLVTALLTTLLSALLAAIALTTSSLLTSLLLTATFVSLVWHFFPPR